MSLVYHFFGTRCVWHSTAVLCSFDDWYWFYLFAITTSDHFDVTV